MTIALRVGRAAPLVTGVLGMAALTFAACGGGDDVAGKGTRITDPAAVPSSTPIQNPVVYHYTGDVVSTSGGAATVSSIQGTTPAAGSKSYTVQPGDNCAGIASGHGITVDALIKANRTINADCTNLKAGDTLKIPAAQTTTTVGGTVGPGTPTPRPSGREYTVAAGDTCGAIAANQGVDVAKLIQLNGLDADCLNLKVGQKLKIP